MLRFDENSPELAHLQHTLLSSGALQDREDAAGDTLFLARELEQVSARSVDVLKHPRLARTMISISNELDAGADSFSYDMYDGLAKAEWITESGDFVGSSEAFKTRFTHVPRSFGSQYGYTIQDLARSQYGRRPLDRERARFCREAHEIFLEDLIAVGDASRGIAGFTNNANFPTVAPITGSWSASTTASQLMADLDKLVQAPEQASKGLFVANRLALPRGVKPFLSKEFSASVADSVEAVWLRKQAANGVKRIDYWHRLDTANAGGNGGRGIAWFDSPDVVRFVLSYDFRELPAQAKGYAFQIGTHARVLGIITVYPLGAAKMERQ